jgi:formate dehydrogenase maturation protein FdhE
VPLLDRLDLPIPSSTATLLEQLSVAMRAAPDTREPAEAMLAALRGHRLHAEQLIGEAVVGHDDHLAALAASVDLPSKLVSLVAEFASRALLAEIARRLRPALSLAAWDQAYCPLCGGLPLVGERIENGAGSDSQSNTANAALRLRLRCSRCAAAWAHTLQRCPDCTNGVFSVIEIEDDTDLDGWQIAACDTCPEYLKIAPSPRSEQLAHLLVDDLETWGLDRWALAEGLQRRVGAGYRLEHGEPAGEELDDD